MKTAIFASAFTLLAVPALADVSVCSGNPSGMYYKMANKLSYAARGFAVQNNPTQGSWHNLELLASGGCDVAFLQADAVALAHSKMPALAAKLKRLGTAGREYVHLICNRESGADDAHALEDGKVTLATGESGSGPWITMSYMSQEDQDYKDLKTVSFGQTLTGITVADGTEAQCMMYVGALGAPYIQSIAGSFSDKLRLVDFDDADFNDAVGPDGRELYRSDEIPSGTYGPMQQNFFAYNVDTVSMDIVLVTTHDAMKIKKDEMERFLNTWVSVRPSIVSLAK